MLLQSSKRHYIEFIKKCVSKLHKKLFRMEWHNLRSVKPIARKFGFYRGQPIDRYYIDKFLEENAFYIYGKTLEVADDRYSRKYGDALESVDILHISANNRNATIIADLTKKDDLPEDTFDCFICTQTLQFIYHVNKAVSGIYKLLRPGGVVLATVPGIAQMSRDDNKRWGEYWRFTELSLFKLFSNVFGKDHVHVCSFGNVLSSIAFLEGLCTAELTIDELDYKDDEYQLLITVVAEKKKDFAGNG